MSKSEFLSRIEAEVIAQGNPRPFVKTVTAVVSLDAFDAATLLLANAEAVMCEDFVVGWNKNGPQERTEENSRAFTRGLLEAARTDAVAFLSDRTDYTAEHLLGADISEAIAVQLTAFVIGDILVARHHEAMVAQRAQVEAEISTKH